MDAHAGKTQGLVSRALVFYVGSSLVPLGVLAYLVATFILPILQLQGEDRLIITVLLAVLLAALLSFLGYRLSRHDANVAVAEMDRLSGGLQRMARASLDIAQAQSREEVAGALARHGRRVAVAKAAVAWFPDAEGLRPLGLSGAARGRDVSISLEKGSGIAGRAFEAGGVAQRNVHLTREDRCVDEVLGIHTLYALAIPLVTASGGIRGVLTVHDRCEGGPFDQEELGMVNAVGLQAAMADENLTLTRQLEDYDRNVLGLIGTMLERAHLWPNHIRNVDAYAQKVAQELRLDDSFRTTLHYAAVLHDVGLERSLRSRKGREPAVLFGHPDRGVELVSGIPVWKACAPMIEGHHARMNGRGYPDRLRGYEIPLGARILALVEWWDEMTNPMSPFLRYSVSEALDLIKNDDEQRFDPPVARAFGEVKARESS